MTTDKCASLHFGPWMIDPEWFRQAVQSIEAGILKPKAMEDEDAPARGEPYKIINQTAVIDIAGPMMKARSKYGGTSTVDTRTQLRKAMNDARVSSIMLHIDSPGGTVAGTDALAADVAAANLVKPVHAHIEDMGASAAYYVASQARRITASKGSLVGSLGVRLSVIDSKSYFEKQGLKIHEINTGPYKSAGADGQEIGEKELAYFQGIVDDAVGHFKAAVQSGRGFTDAKIESLFDGRVHDAATAQQLGLIDNVASFDAAVTAITQESLKMNREQFDAFAAEHPEATARFIEQGKKAGVAEATASELQRCKDINAACPNEPQLAMDAILGGQDAAQAALTFNAVQKREAAAKKAMEAKDAEITRLKEVAEVGGHTGAPIKLKGEKEENPAPPSDPVAAAKADWAANKENCQANFINEKVFVAFRKAEANNQIRASKR